jgi:hypothetical protein
MLIPRVSPKKYQEIFTKKFLNFARKAPIKMSFIITIQDGEEGVRLTHENSGTNYFIKFNYDQQIKDYISEIKKLLVSKHYPRIVDEVFEKHELSGEELAIKLEKGEDIDALKKFELRKIGEKIYTIDKVLMWKDVAILKLETSTFKEDQEDIGKSFQFKFNGSLMMFLNKYRSGKHTLEALSNEFLKNSILVRCLEDTNLTEDVEDKN